MDHRPFAIGLTCLVLGCTGGQWVKEGVGPETVEQDYGECQTWGISQQPQSGTLGDTRGARLDMSEQTVEQCMRGKGYQWVTETTDGR